MRLLVIPACAAFAIGCYSYVPVRSQTPPPATPVRLSLTDQGTADLARFVGPSVSKIDGNLTSADSQQIQISVTRVEKRNGVEEFWTGERIMVPRVQIADVREKQFSRWRSVLVGGGIAAATFFLADAFTGGGVLGVRIAGGGSGGRK